MSEDRFEEIEKCHREFPCDKSRNEMNGCDWCWLIGEVQKLRLALEEAQDITPEMWDQAFEHIRLGADVVKYSSLLEDAQSVIREWACIMGGGHHEDRLSAGYDQCRCGHILSEDDSIHTEIKTGSKCECKIGKIAYD